jgi:hypothetical protein
MGFLKGAVTAVRLKLDGPKPTMFNDEHLDALRKYRIGREKIASADGIEVGWTAGDHVQDGDFNELKNIYPDHLYFEFCTQSDKLPADRLKTYYEIELKALCQGNPSGFPSGRQKKEAREFARERLEQEAKDGRYRKYKTVPVLWSLKEHAVYLGTNSLTVYHQFWALFTDTFTVIYPLYEPFLNVRLMDVELPQPCSFWDDQEIDYPWSLALDDNTAFLGNEFLVWLWWVSKTTDIIGDITFMFSDVLHLECHKGQRGREVIRDDSPIRLPEAVKALQTGKFPRKCGLTLSEGYAPFKFTLNPETMMISGMRLPPVDENVTGREVTEVRFRNIAEAFALVDAMFKEFMEIRTSAEWVTEVAKIRKWVQG